MGSKRTNAEFCTTVITAVQIVEIHLAVIKFCITIAVRVRVRGDFARINNVVLVAILRRPLTLVWNTICITVVARQLALVRDTVVVAILRLSAADFAIIRFAVLVAVGFAYVGETIQVAILGGTAGDVTSIGDSVAIAVSAPTPCKQNRRINEARGNPELVN